YRLAGAAVGDQLLQAYGEAVSGVTCDQPQVLGLSHHDASKLGPIGRVQTTGERLSLTARRRQRVGGQRVGAAGAVDEDRRLQAPAASHRLEAITALVGERVRIDVVALGGANEAAGREHDRHRLIGNERGLIDGLRGLPLDDAGAPLIAVLGRILADLAGDELLQSHLALQQRLELLALGHELLLLLTDLHLLELGEVTQPGVEDLLGLLVRELEALHQHRLRLILAADDADHLVEIEVDDEQAIQDVQPPADPLQPVLQASGDGGNSEIEPLRQDGLEPHDARASIEADDVEVDAIVALEIRRGEQV